MFLYFVESERNRCGDAELQQWGIRYAIDTPRIGIAREGISPSGKRGLLISDESTGTDPSYRPDKQTWRQCFDRPGVWIGYEGDQPPHPITLARRHQLPGRDVRLSDGSRLLIPHARRWSDYDGRLLWSVALPQSLRRDDGGRWVPDQVVGQYRLIWDLMTEFIDARETAIREADVAEGDSVYFHFDRIDDLAIAAIRANYRMDADEVEICGLYDQRVRGDIIEVLMDSATQEAWVKKKLQAMTAAGGSSSAGPAASTPGAEAATPPPSPTCTPTASECTADESASSSLDSGPSASLDRRPSSLDSSAPSPIG